MQSSNTEAVGNAANMEVVFTVGGQGTVVGGKEVVVKVAKNNQFVDEFSIDFRVDFRMTNFVMSSNL